MRNPFFLFCLFLFLCLTQNSLALQAVSIADNQTKQITVSAHELSRIFVKGDRIQNVRGLEGAYLLTKDEVQGQIFIKPTPPYQTKPFNLFVSTEKGHNFNLLVIATEALGQDIEIKPTTPNKEAEIWEKGSDYSQILVKLIVGMVKNELPPGYSVVYPDKKTKEVKYDGVTAKLIKRYMGKSLYGEELLITSTCKHPLNLSEEQFYHKGVRAISILNSTLPANGESMLYRVMNNE
jgi:conjugal transfer pilus assembly protein TraK